MTITPLHPEPDTSIYHVNEPDAIHTVCGWYYVTPLEIIKGVWNTATEAAIEASKDADFNKKGD